MNKKTVAALLLSLTFTSLPAAAAPKQDRPGCADHPLFPNRMPNRYIISCDVKEFDAAEFSCDKRPCPSVEGKVTIIRYGVDEPKNDRSALEVVRNYENALKKIGGTVTYSNPRREVANGSVVVDGKEVWFQVEKRNLDIWLKIAEKKAMEQTIVADAASFANDLKSTGHVAIYGILFETGKADVKPESGQAIGEIAKLLKGDGDLKLFVVGHTDAVGAVEANLKLSEARAEAVLQALVRTHGIAAARLRAFGAGPFTPVAANDTEEGRTRNRRVELVKQ
ncbi:MAG: OmpA family protein [Deltaproteobacteria bacterium]|nr:OmpA family protein [Deltaproteobacteria bacterium]